MASATPAETAKTAPAKPLSIAYWPAIGGTHLEDVTCGDVLRRAAARWPDRIALVDPGENGAPGRRWSYAALLKEAETIAGALATRYPPGSHIAIFAANCAEWVFVQFGTAIAGLVLVTVNPACGAKELGYILRQSRSRGVFHQRDYRGSDMRALIAEAEAAESLALDMIVDLHELKAFCVSESPVSTLPQVSSQAPAMIQYTSGTTGYPKGVLLSHHSIANTSRVMAEIKQLDCKTVNLSVAPLFHTGGCVGGVLGSVQTGGTLVLMQAFEAERMLDIIEYHRVTYSFAVPTMLIALLEAQRRLPRDLSSLDMMFSGGSTVPVDIVRRTEEEFGVRLIIGYGLTESSPAITHTRPGDSPTDIAETIGRAIPMVEVKVIDPATGLTVAVGVPGELCCRGFNVMMCYYDMPAETAEAIDSDGWLHTGDLCVMDDRGYCRVTGRIKDMIIRGGENIYPREIEELLFSHAAISSVAVFGLPDDYWGEQVAAAIVFNSGKTADAADLTEHCSARLARHKVPKFWYAVDSLPLTPSGKIQKFRLSEDAAAGLFDKFRV